MSRLTRHVKIYSAARTRKRAAGERRRLRNVKLREFQRNFTAMEKKAFTAQDVLLRSEFRPAFQQRTEIGAARVQTALRGHVSALEAGKVLCVTVCPVYPYTVGIILNKTDRPLCADRIDKIPHHLLFRRHFKQMAVESGADKIISVGELLGTALKRRIKAVRCANLTGMELPHDLVGFGINFHNS